jgi:hypothetical protein
MELNNVINAVLMDLTLENLKIQDKLVTTMNENLPLDEKITSAKQILLSLINNEAMTIKFQEIINNNKENEKK